jgi:hypothetical protein
MRTRHFLSAILSICVVFVAFDAYAAGKSWLYPTFSIIEEYDSNIFLEKSGAKHDFISYVVPGIAFEPKLNQHKLKVNYKAEYTFFQNYPNQNGVNHIGQLASTFNFTDWKVETNDFFTKGKSRSGSEITARIPRTFNNADIKATRMFNHLDVGVKYVNRLERYDSTDAIGSYQGHSLNYKDINTDENSGELEFAAKFWPKTFALFSTRIGTLKYLTGKKSDSIYYDALVGLRGKFTGKSVVEGKIGYRKQNYERYDDDFSSPIFLGNMLQSFDERNTLQFSFERTTSPTNYTSNAYYATTFLFSEFVHGFTKRFKGKTNVSYQLNDYPTETTEGTKTDHRTDQLWTGGLGLSYELVRWGTINLDYIYSKKTSNFDNYDYVDNRVSLGMVVDF